MHNIYLTPISQVLNSSQFDVNCYIPLYSATTNGKKRKRNGVVKAYQGAVLYHSQRRSREKAKILLGSITKRQADKEKRQFEQVLEDAPPSGSIFNLFSTKYLKWHSYEHPASHARIHQIKTTALISNQGLISLK